MRTAPFAAALAAFLSIAGCASHPERDDSTTLSPGTPTTGGEEAPGRVSARIHTQLAATYLEIGNLGVALEEVKEALRYDTSYGPAYNVAGLVYARLKEERLAEQNFLRALEMSPNDSDAHNNYGSYLCDRKREREAIKHFLAAVRNPLYQTPDRSYVNAGLCARRAGDPAAATEYFMQALRTRPTEPQALYQLADMAYARADYGTAKEYLSRLARDGVSTAEVLWLGARLGRRLGDRDVEASYARQLKNRFPNSAEARALAAGQFE